MLLKYRFKALLVEPRRTTSSEEHSKVMKGYGLDRHVASAYLVALKALNQNQIK